MEHSSVTGDQKKGKSYDNFGFYMKNKKGSPPRLEQEKKSQEQRWTILGP